MSNWNLIVEENVAGVMNAAFRILGNLTDAEDIAQEVFTEAFQKWDANSDQNWSGLLKRMTVCRSIDLLRLSRGLEPLPPFFADRKTTDPLDATLTREFQQRLRTETGKLPSREAQVFCLVHFENLSQSQVAETLSLSTTAVTSALSKARHKLQKIFLKTAQGESR